MLTSSRLNDNYDSTGYYRDGFVFMQNLIMKAFLSLKGNESIIEDVPEIFIQKFPYPPGVIDTLILPLQIVFTLFLLLTYIYPVINIVKTLVDEKESKLQQSMEIMGEIVS